MKRQNKAEQKIAPSILESDSDYWFNACLNYAPDQLALYISGYRGAAEILLEHVLSARVAELDTLVFPIIFLYRHYIELRLKSLIKCGSTLLELSLEIPYTHNISVLWKSCKDVFIKIWPDDIESIEETEREVMVFSELDPNSESFRYAQDKGGHPTLPGFKYINLTEVQKKMSKITPLLEGADTGISHYLDLRSSML